MVVLQGQRSESPGAQVIPVRYIGQLLQWLPTTTISQNQARTWLLGCRLCLQGQHLAWPPVLAPREILPLPEWLRWRSTRREVGPAQLDSPGEISCDNEGSIISSAMIIISVGTSHLVNTNTARPMAQPQPQLIARTHYGVSLLTSRQTIGPRLLLLNASSADLCSTRLLHNHTA